MNLPSCSYEPTLNASPLPAFTQQLLRYLPITGERSIRIYSTIPIVPMFRKIKSNFVQPFAIHAERKKFFCIEQFVPVKGQRQNSEYVYLQQNHLSAIRSSGVLTF